MSEPADRLPPWDGLDLEALLRLETVAPMRYRSRYGDPNPGGRSYGGQLMGQAMMAAGHSVATERQATCMQFLFLQGAVSDLPLDLEVSVLQEGKRYSSRHVRASQPGGRVVLDMHVTYTAPVPGPEHTQPSTAQESPQSLARPRDMAPDAAERMAVVGDYSLDGKPCLDFRMAEPADGLMLPSDPRQRFWMRAALDSNDRRVHEAAFAYLSDWWINCSAHGPYANLSGTPGQDIFVVSLNQTIWFHTALRADGWLHFDDVSPRAGEGRGLSQAKVHDEAGRFVATVAQECMLIYSDAPPRG